MLNQYKTYQFNFNDLSINRDNIDLLLGYKPGEAPEPFPEMINEIFSQAPAYCDIQGGYTILPIKNFNINTAILEIENIQFNIQKIVANQLKMSESVALFACSAGKGMGEWSRHLMAGEDLVKGFIIDTLGSVVVEAAMDIIHDNIEKEMSLQKLKITNRYSPGYCSWSTVEQQKLFSFFPEEFCGITLTESSLMYPIKSISGIIGIGKDVRKNSYTCQICDSKSCIYRNVRLFKE